MFFIWVVLSVLLMVCCDWLQIQLGSAETEELEQGKAEQSFWAVHRFQGECFNLWVSLLLAKLWHARGLAGGGVGIHPWVNIKTMVINSDWSYSWGGKFLCCNVGNSGLFPLSVGDYCWFLMCPGQSWRAGNPNKLIRYNWALESCKAAWKEDPWRGTIKSLSPSLL